LKMEIPSGELSWRNLSPGDPLNKFLLENCTRKKICSGRKKKLFLFFYQPVRTSSDLLLLPHLSGSLARIYSNHKGIHLCLSVGLFSLLNFSFF
jgi:hypothetical protein